MVAVKAHQAAAFLKSPDRALIAFLFFGTDAGLIGERARFLAKLIAERESPPGEQIRLDETDLDEDPERLTVELQTMPMFGGAKVVRAMAGRRVTAASLRPLIDGGLMAGTLIVEAQNLKPDDSLRALFEKSPRTAAIACYGDDAHDLDSLVRTLLGAAGLQISDAARQLAVSRLGADRALSRCELDKLMLYSHGKSQVSVEDVEAIMTDASELAIDRVVLAAASGDAGAAIVALDRALASGESAQMMILAIQRHIQRLHRVRSAMDRGSSLDEALRALRPPVHFKVKDTIAAQCRQWTTDKLGRALTTTAQAALKARLASNLDAALTERLILNLAGLARGRAAA